MAYQVRLIYSTLLNLMTQHCIQVIDSDQNCVLSGQERWFTTLPPVLFLELSRFQFNTSKGIAEKVNNVLEFPQEIFLDRYLQSNKVTDQLELTAIVVMNCL